MRIFWAGRKYRDSCFTWLKRQSRIIFYIRPKESTTQIFSLMAIQIDKWSVMKAFILFLKKKNFILIILYSYLYGRKNLLCLYVHANTHHASSVPVCPWSGKRKQAWWGKHFLQKTLPLLCPGFYFWFC